MNENKLEQIIKDLLINIGEDPDRDGLQDTPRRVAKYYREVLIGYNQDPALHGTTFPAEGVKDLIVVKDINFYSLCEHHLVPFFGTVSIGYLPDKTILGLSKFGRIVEVFSRRLQVQERLNKQILDAVLKILAPKGAAVKIQAKHLCMSMRGIQKDDAVTVTTQFSGELRDNDKLRKEFLSSVK